MDVFEQLNKAFVKWYESLFGDGISDVRPKDVLRKIVTAMEDSRKEGLDNRIYVPNKYILEMCFESDEEREYLLAFLDKDELEGALRKYMSQNKYYIRGPLDITIEEVAPAEGNARPEKVRVKCKWDVRPMEKEMGDPPLPPAPAEAQPGTPYEPYEEEEYTVAATDLYDAGTVAPPVLDVKRADGSSMQFTLSKHTTLIGRSHRLGNDLVIDWDGMVSKRHAQITLTPEGFVITDLNSTNGVWVNEQRISRSRALRNGDVIRLGATEMVFSDTSARASLQVPPRTPVRKPRLIVGSDDFPLASQIVIGRSLGSDLRLDESSVARRHAKVFSPDGESFYLEDLGSETGTAVNGLPLAKGVPVKLQHGDRIRIGQVELRYELD